MNIKILVDKDGREIAVDTDEIVMIASVGKRDRGSARNIGRNWKLYLKSGVSVVVEYDLPIEDVLSLLGIRPWGSFRMPE